MSLLSSAAAHRPFTVIEAQAREERTAGETIVDEGDGGIQLVEFLASRNLINQYRR